MILFGSELIKVGTEYTAWLSAANEVRYRHTLSIALLSFTPGFSPVIQGHADPGTVSTVFMLRL